MTNSNSVPRDNFFLFLQTVFKLCLKCIKAISDSLENFELHKKNNNELYCLKYHIKLPNLHY